MIITIALGIILAVILLPFVIGLVGLLLEGLFRALPYILLFGAVLLLAIWAHHKQTVREQESIKSTWHERAP